MDAGARRGRHRRRGRDIVTLAHAYAMADRAQLCWTLGITEHHNGVDNVRVAHQPGAAHRPRRSGRKRIESLRGQNNVQGGGDMGAVPNRLPGFQDILDDEAAHRFDRAWGTTIQPRYGKHLTAMFEAMEHGELRTVFCLGENPAQSEADISRARRLLQGLDHLVVQDIFLTKTAELAHVVLPATAAWCESEGTVTNSRAAGAASSGRLSTAPEAPATTWTSSCALPAGSATNGLWRPGLAGDSAEAVWDELRSVSPMHRGMSYARLEALSGIQWPCYDEDRPRAAVPARSAVGRRSGRAGCAGAVQRRAPMTRRWTSSRTSTRCSSRPAAGSTRTTPACNPAPSPRRCVRARRSTCRPDDAAAIGVTDGEIVRVTSRRGDRGRPGPHRSVGLRPGLVFMTFHFADDVDVNLLTIEANDPRRVPPSSRPPRCASTN